MFSLMTISTEKYVNPIPDAQKLVSELFKVLLTEKHLYQKIDIKENAIDDIVRFRKEECIKEKYSFNEAGYRNSLKFDLNKLWSPPEESLNNATIIGVDQKISFMSAAEKQKAFLFFPLPPIIEIYCTFCEKQTPFHPLKNIKIYQLENYHEKNERIINERGNFPSQYQIFILPYECQCCQKTPLLFLIKREAWKLELCGRNFIEDVIIPPYLPKDSGKFFKESMIAFHCGKTLAAIFYLRTFIEQYWRSFSANKILIDNSKKTLTKISAEKLNENYNATLSLKMRATAPSLFECYERLSAAIHEAREEEALLKEIKFLIESHFECKSIFSKLENFSSSIE